MTGRNLVGQIKSAAEVESAGIRTILFGFPLISIILGSIISSFTSKKRSYKERFINTSLIILLVFYSAMFVLEIRYLILGII